ncbi:hypothetical protein ACQPXH_11865 [Nocardia sp. CA-135953]|uniref:hypothetical protein n=1 Tax=Nocardia sp. CA-135953 TaxID=3239978 RepID=UPI003D95B408
MTSPNAPMDDGVATIVAEAGGMHVLVNYAQAMTPHDHSLGTWDTRRRSTWTASRIGLGYQSGPDTRKARANWNAIV